MDVCRICGILLPGGWGQPGLQCRGTVHLARPSAKHSHLGIKNPKSVHPILAACLQTRGSVASGMGLGFTPCLLQINTFQSWKHIANADALIKLAPAAGATLVLLLTLKLGRSPLALPVVLVCIPVRLWPVPVVRNLACQPILASPADPCFWSWRL